MSSQASEMKYIIMCGGEYPEWDKPRHLTKICGEPIVKRTIRLLRENGVKDIAITANDKKRFRGLGVPVLSHDNSYVMGSDGAWVNAFYPTEEPACYIFGDVVFSPEAIRTIVETETDGIQFFASSPPFSELYTKPWAEPFAFKVVDQVRFRMAVNFIRTFKDSDIFNRHPIAWELWQAINSENVKTINFRNYIAINDYTCDIDEPGDAEKIERMIKAWT